jgi:integrase
MPVYKRGRHWQIVIWFKGKRHRISTPSMTREGARDHETLLRSELIKYGEFISLKKKQAEDAMPTLNEFFPRWMADYVIAHNRPKEQKNKTGTMEHHLLPVFGKFKINVIAAEHIDKYKQMKLSEGLNPKTINNHLQILHRCLTTAQEWSLLEQVPTTKQLKAPEPPWRYLSREDAEKLIAVIPEDFRRTMFLMSIKTGLRYSELSALRWEDVDFERNEVTVRRSIVEGNIGSTKNNRIRRIPMTKDVREALEQMPRTDGYVFTYNEKPVLYKTSCGWLKKFCKDAGIQNVTIHQLRHTFASHLVALGAPLLSVRQLMGHGDIKMTMRYAHLGPNELQHAVDLLTKN